MPEPLSRREALAAGLAGAAALALYPATAAAASAAEQGAALTALGRAEEDAAFVYLDAGLGGLLAAQEDEHARAFASHLQALGLPIPEPTRSRSRLGSAALGVLEATGEAERLRAAIALEEALIAGCAGRLGQLEQPGVIRTVATVMASHAQHLALHRRAAGLDPFSPGE